MSAFVTGLCLGAFAWAAHNKDYWWAAILGAGAGLNGLAWYLT